MSNDTFGSYVVRRRKDLGFSQKELASRILREEDQKPISPQYLNDIERDRRQPTSEHLIMEFARALKEENADYLFYLAGTIPNELRSLPKERVAEVFKAFRRPNNK
jgi:transcriptional regulator with XRE-family HTH domain